MDSIREAIRSEVSSKHDGGKRAASIELEDRVNDIVREETRVIHNDPGHMAATGISRAAHRAARSATELVNGYSTMDGIARVFGIEPRVDEATASLRRRLMVEHFSDEERKRYGYGDLPDVLITEVKRRTLSVLPENARSKVANDVAARTMHIVQREGFNLTAHEVRELLAIVNVAQPLDVRQGEMTYDELVVLDSVVTIAHDCSATYYRERASLVNGVGHQLNPAVQVINE